MYMTTAGRMSDLPWSVHPDEQRRYKRILVIVLSLTIAFSIAIPLLPTPRVDRKKLEEIPPRLAQLIIEKQKLPPPPPPKLKPKKKKPVKKDVKKPKKKKVVKTKPKPKPKPKPTAREKAEQSVMAFKDLLEDMRDDTVSTTKLKSANAGAAIGQDKKNTRSLITSNVTQASGGINTAKFSRNTGGAGALADRDTTRVKSSLGKARSGKVKRGNKSRKAARTIEEIALVFDRHKGSIYSIYNRELRKDPSLEGKVVLELTIAPSGKVTRVRIISSELVSKSLNRKLKARVRSFNFGRKNVETMVVTYPIEFLPS
ncbi:MAG TPA: energy transducer TonB [Gammaproteobacteria bacterium]|nr:energy transducer TonB [Gammaproteobacteria bacterium]